VFYVVNPNPTRRKRERERPANKAGGKEADVRPSEKSVQFPAGDGAGRAGRRCGGGDAWALLVDSLHCRPNKGWAPLRGETGWAVWEGLAPAKMMSPTAPVRLKGMAPIVFSAGAGKVKAKRASRTRKTAEERSGGWSMGGGPTTSDQPSGRAPSQSDAARAPVMG